MTIRGWLLIGFLLALVAGGALAWPRLEKESPSVEAPDAITLGAQGTEIALRVSDGGSGLRSLVVELETAEGMKPLQSRAFTGGLWDGGTSSSRSAELQIELDPQKLELEDGEATLHVRARDWSWRNGLDGNATEVAVPVRIDTRPPSVQIESGLTYLYRGGSGAAVYRVGEEVEWDGVDVGGARFRGHPLGDDGRRVAIFAIPVDAPAKVEVHVIARDHAGNPSRRLFPARIFDRSFTDGDVNLPASILQDKIPELAKKSGVATGTPTGDFAEINRSVREKNEAEIRERIANGDPKPLFEGAFRQWPGSKVTSRFAELRRYKVAGQEVSQARHYGFDLAATSRASVTASNRGRVRFAGELGIYGNCVLLDHGLGISTLYGHLSEIDVKAGDEVASGQQIGRSGSTGLAGGDHLHFAILVGETYVDPVEWWDPKWVREHIAVRLEASGP